MHVGTKHTDYKLLEDGELTLLFIATLTTLINQAVSAWLTIADF